MSTPEAVEKVPDQASQINAALLSRLRPYLWLSQLTGEYLVHRNSLSIILSMYLLDWSVEANLEIQLQNPQQNL